MIGQTEILFRNFKKVDEAQFMIAKDDDGLIINGEVIVFADLRDNSGVLCARTTAKPEWFVFCVISDYNNYPLALAILAKQISSRCESLRLSYEADESLTPSPLWS
jgi:hypothetical protein